jgi:myo-inositol-1(or 4)-monophosphatase
VGEERGGKAPADGSPYWLLDPICGTRNYASGLPLYSTNLALVENGRVTVAAVGDALGRELQVAETGGGAWALKDGAWRSIHASDDSRIVVAEEGKSTDPRRTQGAMFISAAIRADRWDVRSFGSTVAFPQLAAGRIAAYVVFWAGIEHIAAGILLAQEAGAIVTQIDGRPWSIASDSLIAAASRDLHAQLLSLARGTA